MIKINDKWLCENCFTEIEKEPCPVCGYSKESYVRDPMTLAAGSMLGERYAVGKAIGKGGFGITYLAYDTKLECKVAIKEYYPYGLAVRNPGSTLISVSNAEAEDTFKSGADKFYDEARLVAKFNGNPNIVSVHDFFYENDTVYFTMGYLDGMTLKSYLKGFGALSPGQAVSVAQAVSNALMAAHSLNVLHRDISPDNIMVCRDGTIKLLDFGAARQVVTEDSQSLSVILKQGFAPLEQYQKKGKQGPWTDIYSLGATLYHALTLDALDDPMSRLEEDEEYNSNKHHITEELWGIIKKATALRMQERYQDIFEFKRDLNGLSIREESLDLPGGTAENVNFGAAAGRTGSAGQDTGARPGDGGPAAEDLVGVTRPLEEETVGMTKPLQEEDEIGVTRPLQEEESTKNMDALGEADSQQEDDFAKVTARVREQKKKRKRKVVGILEAVVVAAVAVAAVVFLAVVIFINTREYRYVAYSNYIEITKYQHKDSVVTIPSEIKGKPVMKIGWKAFSDCESLTSVKIPDSVTEIGDFAFNGCSSLTSIELPDSVTRIGWGAFEGCSSLTSIELPDSVTEIGDFAFNGCSSLTSVELPDSVTRIGWGAFGGCSNNLEIIRRDSTAQNQDSAIGDSDEFSAVTDMPDTSDSPASNPAAAGEDVSESAAADFEYTVYDNYVEINGYKGSDLFLVIPAEIENKPVTKIGDSAFEWSSVVSEELPDSITEIGEFAFYHCSNIMSMELPDGVTEIGESAFEWCISLASIEIPSGVKEIKWSTFYCCKELTEARIPEDAEIVENAFEGCDNLTITRY